MKKGQAALEFLMTYGWAILVVLAAIGALAYFGVLSPERFLPSKCIISGGFSCTEYKLDGTADEVRLYVQNNLGADADSVNVTLTDADGTDCTSTNGSNILGIMTNGEKSSAITFDGGCTTSLAGTSFKGDIKVVYVKGGETESHIATGSVSGKFE